MNALFKFLGEDLAVVDGEVLVRVLVVMNDEDCTEVEEWLPAPAPEVAPLVV